MREKNEKERARDEERKIKAETTRCAEEEFKKNKNKMRGVGMGILVWWKKKNVRMQGKKGKLIKRIKKIIIDKCYHNIVIR